jgi:NAD(P)-dependent dehydrogenase (short-subunit alcohol dehydrogenase family)
MSTTDQLKVAVFGASGAIGGALVDWFLDNGHEVAAFSRSGATPAGSRARWIAWDGISAFPSLAERPFDAMVWAQGANYNDDIRSFDLAAHERLYAANVTYILVSLQAILAQHMLKPAARLCVISSIWQNFARQNKLSYCVTKSALQGLVQSLAGDLGADGHLVNAVLPGPLDTPMTRANLNAEQITRLENMMPLGTLPALHDVSNLVGFLCSKSNTGLTGQFIAADKGFSSARIV